MCLNLMIKYRMRLPYNLKVFKTLMPTYGRVVLHDGTVSGIKLVGYITPFQREEVEFKDGVFEQEAEPDMIKPDYKNAVYYGIHSYYDQCECERTTRLLNGTYRWAVIPAGSDFYVGSNCDIVSSKLLVFETYADLIKYEENYGTAMALVVSHKGAKYITEFHEPYIENATIVEE